VSAKTTSGLFWTTDEDGERVHRLQCEWDGNKGPWREWGDYHSQADRWAFSLGAAWSRWGLGIEYDWAHESSWEDGSRVRYRRQDVTLTVGPWYVAWSRCRPLARPEGGAS
jgi:hypothetical protein